jgi:hypothetical protein
LNEKGYLPVWGWRCSNKRAFESPAVLGTAKSIRNKQPNLAIRIVSLLIKSDREVRKKQKVGDDAHQFLHSATHYTTVT